MHNKLGNLISHADDKNDDKGLVSDIDARFDIQQPLNPTVTTDESQTDPHLGENQPTKPQTYNRLTLTMAEIKHIYNEEVVKVEEEKPESMSFASKCFYYINFPIQLLSMATIPNVDDEKIGSWYTPILPFTSMLASVTLTKSIIP